MRYPEVRGPWSFLHRAHSARRLAETPPANKTPQGRLRERKDDRSGQIHAHCLGAALGCSLVVCLPALKCRRQRRSRVADVKMMSGSVETWYFLHRDHSARCLEETPRRNKAPQGGLRARKDDRSGQTHAQSLGATSGCSLVVCMLALEFRMPRSVGPWYFLHRAYFSRRLVETPRRNKAGCVSGRMIAADKYMFNARVRRWAFTCGWCACPEL